MAYLGNAPARSFISFERQVFTIVNSQTAYTLSHSVNNENDIRLVVNNVVQEPGSGKAYTASGTTLTLSAALVNGTDEMYCVFLGRAVATNKPGAGSVGTTELAADAVTGAKIADDAISDEHLDPTAITGQTAEATIASDDLILLSDTSASGALKKMTRSNFVSGIGGVNTPAFHVYRNGNQSISNNTTTKVQFNAETFDTANAFDSSTNYRFTPQTSGKYYFYAGIYIANGSSASLEEYQIQIQKNGSSKLINTIDRRTSGIGYNISVPVSGLLEANGSSDYFEVHANVVWGGGSQNIIGAVNQTYFGGYKIIE